MRSGDTAALALLAMILAAPGCGQAGRPAPPTVQVALGADGRLVASAPPPGGAVTSSVALDDGAGFTVAVPDACSLRGTIRRPAEGRFEVVMDLACQVPTRLDVRGFPDLVVTRDGVAAEAVAVYPAGTHRVVAAGRVP